MPIRTIKKFVDIMAHKETVWDILFNNELNKKWYQQFSSGAHAKTDWKQGSQAIFTDDSGHGMIGRIKENKPYDGLVIEYYGYMNQGKEDTLSEGAKAIKGALETYELIERNGMTRLYVRSDIEDTYFENLSDAWDRALQKIKSMAEK